MFKVGDVVEIIGSDETPEKARKYIGTITTVTDVFFWGLTNEWACHTAEGDVDGRGWYCRALRLVPPKSNYDGNQAGDWSLIPWAPKRERVS